MTEHQPRPLPWRLGDLLAFYGSLFGAALLLVAAWWGASGTAQLSSQIMWVNVGVAGIMLAGAGIVVWLLTGRRAVGERRRWLLGDVPVEVEADVAAPVARGDDRLVTGPAMTHYHRASCALVAGKQVHADTTDAFVAAGLRPCGICRP